VAYSTRTDPTQKKRCQEFVQRSIGLRIPAISLLMWLAIAQPCAAGAPAPQDAKPTTTQQAVPLEKAKPIERELAGSEVHAYSIQLTTGQFLNVVVGQYDIDVVVTVFAPDGKQLARFDSPIGDPGPEPVTLIAEASGNYRLEVASLEKAAAVGRYQVNLEALRLAVSEDEKLVEASALINSANVHYSQQNYALALEAYQKSLPLSEAAGNAAGNKGWLAYTLGQLGWMNFLQDNYARAVEYSLKSLTLGEESGNKFLVACVLDTLSVIYRGTGNFAQALECAQRSLALRESLADKVGVSGSQLRIGMVYSNMGDDARALKHFHESLALREKLDRKDLIAEALQKLGDAYNVQGDYEQAWKYAQRSLKLGEEMKDYRQTIFATLTIGNIHLGRRDSARALEYYEKALALNENVGEKGSVAKALIGISSAHINQGNYPQALEAAERAATIAGQIGSRELLLFALYRAGFSYLSLNQFANARRAAEQAIELVESLRASVPVNEARSNFFASVIYPYELDVDVLMQLHKQHPSEGHDAAALQVSERGRARSLLEALNEARADIRQGVDPALLTSERSWQQRLNAAAERQTRLLSGKHTEAQTVRLQKEVDALTSNYQQVEAQIRQSSPRYAALTQPAPLTVSEIQRDVLDAATALLEYALGEERSYLWVVTPTSVKSFELPRRAEIETSVRRVVGLLNDGKSWATSAHVNTEYAAAADQLSRTLLPPALISPLKVKRLVIVGDGALQYLPFEALPTPRSLESEVWSLESKTRNPSRRRNADSRLQTPAYKLPLIADYEIVTLPSASTLAVLRRETANRAPPTKSIAILADPVFEETDERVQTATARGGRVGNRQPAAATPEASLEQSINSRTLLRAFEFESNADANGAAPEQLRITRLPFTRFEAEGILKAAPPGQSLKATDFRANRETATSAELARYRFVHFATHGVLNSEHPELSGLVLSLVNEQGQPVDGFLRLHDIYNLNLPADLVVLSACQTGLGKEIRGEGLVGLTRGFMYAGAPRVVASLWKVDDAATAELMKRFYQGMLKDNLRPAAALRAAKVEMWKQNRWRAPFYWAAFELQGEWK
jgi:CHAT domain-containing protein/tetratricopeptide (TPR) repeat protein